MPIFRWSKHQKRTFAFVWKQNKLNSTFFSVDMIEIVRWIFDNTIANIAIESKQSITKWSHRKIEASYPPASDDAVDFVIITDLPNRDSTSTWTQKRAIVEKKTENQLNFGVLYKLELAEVFVRFSFHYFVVHVLLHRIVHHHYLPVSFLPFEDFQFDHLLSSRIHERPIDVDDHPNATKFDKHSASISRNLLVYLQYPALTYLTQEINKWNDLSTRCFSIGFETTIIISIKRSVVFRVTSTCV